MAPGLAGLETTLALHDVSRIGHPEARWGVIDGNPVHDDVRAIAAATGVTFALDVVLDGDQRIVSAFGGDVLAMHAAACDKARADRHAPSTPAFRCRRHVQRRLSSRPEPLPGGQGDVSGGPGVKPGGMIVCLAECRDGFPAHGPYRSELAAASSPQALLDRIATRPATVADQWQVQIQASIMARARASSSAPRTCPTPIWPKPTSSRPTTRAGPSPRPGRRPAFVPYLMAL